MYILIPTILPFSIQLLVRVNFGISNPRVADMKDCLPNRTFLQYADDSTIFQQCRIKDLKTSCINTEGDLSRLLNWSNLNNLQ